MLIKLLDLLFENAVIKLCLVVIVAIAILIYNGASQREALFLECEKSDLHSKFECYNLIYSGY